MMRNRSGFTMVEIVVVMAITAIVAALAVASLAPWFASYAAAQRQSNAENLYMSLQSSMVNLKAQGRLSVLDGCGDDVVLFEDAQGGNSSSVLLASSDASQREVLESIGGSLDSKVSAVSFMSSGSIGEYLVELDPSNGYVYGVFYSEEAITQADYQAASPKRSDTQALTAMKIAYYGGGSVVEFEAADSSTNGYVGYFEFDKRDGAYSLSGMHAYRYADTDGEDGEDLTKLNATLVATGDIDKACYGVLVSQKSNPAVSANPESLLGTVLDDTTLKATDISVSISNDSGIAVDYLLYEYKDSALANNDSWTPMIEGRTYALNANFAASVKTSGSFDATSTYQVRTASQLQHIGQPLDEPYTAYLAGSFIQTHDISIKKAWVPIGVESGKKETLASFTGSYCGAVDLQSVSEGTIAKTPKAPQDDASARGFSIQLKGDCMFSILGKTKGVSSLASDGGSQLYAAGIFGSLEGGISHVDVKSSGNLGMVQAGTVLGSGNLGSLSVGTLVGVVRPKASIRQCSLHVSEGDLALCDTALKFKYGYLGGLIGACASSADNLSVSVGKGAALSLKPTASDSNPRAVYAGGITGFTSDGTSLAKAAVDVDGKLTVQCQDAGYDFYLGGMAGLSEGDIADGQLRISEGGAASVKGSSAKEGSALAYAGGVAGILKGSASDVACQIDGALQVSTSSKVGKDTCAGGFFGLMYGSSSSDNSMTVNGELEVSAGNGTGDGVAYAGGFAGGLGNAGTVSHIKATVTGTLMVTAKNGCTVKESKAEYGYAYAAGLIACMGQGETSASDMELAAKGAVVSIASNAAMRTAASGLAVGFMERLAQLSSPKATIAEKSDVRVNARWGSGISSYKSGAAKSTGSNAAAGGIVGYLQKATVKNPRLALSGKSSLTMGDESAGPSFAGGIVGFHNSGTVSMGSSPKAIQVLCEKGGSCKEEHIDLYAVNNVGVVCGGKEFNSYLLNYQCSNHNDTGKYLDGYAVGSTAAININDYMHLYPKVQ